MTGTTTHDTHGGGRPRLVFTLGGVTQTRDPQREFYLYPGVTTIGSANDNDLILDGLDAHHAEIRRDTEDEYIFVQVGADSSSTVHGAVVSTALLRSGALIVFGDWALAYLREGHADHGRPYGGIQGGELEHQREQNTPRPRGTSPTGGSDPRGTDPGEYY